MLQPNYKRMHRIGRALHRVTLKRLHWQDSLLLSFCLQTKYGQRKFSELENQCIRLSRIFEQLLLRQPRGRSP
jgi:hypothetical protein